MTKKEGIKKIAKDNGVLGGISISYILVLVAQSQGIPITETEAVLLTGMLGGIGSKIKEIFVD